MEIKASQLKMGVEVDMPVEWKERRQRTIAYDATKKKFVLKDIKTGEIHYSYTKLSDLIRTTNQIFNYNDIAIEGE